MSVTYENSNLWQTPITVKPLSQAFFIEEGGERTELPSNVVDVKSYRSKKLVMTEDKTRLFGVFGEKAQIVPHYEAVEIMEDSLRNFFGEDPKMQITVLKDGETMKLLAPVPGQFIPVGNDEDDLSQLQILLYNSYKPGMGRGIQLGAERQVCTNGMVIYKSFAHISLEDLVKGWTKKTIEGKLSRLLDSGQQLKQIWEHWGQLPVTFDLAARVVGSRFPKSMQELVLRESEFPMSKWDLYNRLTNLSTHESSGDQTRFSLDNMIASIFYGGRSDLVDHELAEMEVDGWNGNRVAAQA